MSNIKFGAILGIFAVVLMFAIYFDSTIIPTKTISFEAQELQCIPSGVDETDPDWICFGDKDLFWGMTYYAPLIAIYEDKEIRM